MSEPTVAAPVAPTHLLYLHGFRSCPASFKARRLLGCSLGSLNLGKAVEMKTSHSAATGWTRYVIWQEPPPNLINKCLCRYH